MTKTLLALILLLTTGCASLKESLGDPFGPSAHTQYLERKRARDYADSRNPNMGPSKVKIHEMTSTDDTYITIRNTNLNPYGNKNFQLNILEVEVE